MRKLLIALVVIVLLLLAADRVGAYVAGREVAEKVSQQSGVSGDVDASVRGFPFLTQLARRDFSDVHVTVPGYTSGQVPVHDIDATLHDVRVTDGFSKATAGSVSATALVRYADLQKQAPVDGLTITQGQDGAVKIAGSISLLGQSLDLSATAELQASGRSVVVVPNGVQIGGAGSDQSLSDLLGQQLRFPVEVTGLPQGLTLSAVRAVADGVRVTATGQRVALQQ